MDIVSIEMVVIGLRPFFDFFLINIDLRWNNISKL